MVIHREQFTEITEGVDSLDNESNRDEISYDPSAILWLKTII